MIELDNLKIELNSKKELLTEIYNSLDITKKNDRITEINKLMEDSNFWNDVDKASKVSKELKELTESINSFEKLKNNCKDIEELIELANSDDDKNLSKEIFNHYEAFCNDLETTRTSLLLSGEYDELDAILRLNAGSGGTESCDFCQMLYRMYTKYANNHNFDVSIFDYLDGDEAGIKSVSFVVKGKYAYGYLKSELGVHRLVRLSPFNAQNKRQTSFVSLDVMPDIKDNINIELNDDDLKFDYYRSSGAGGQHVNKTSSAVRVTHLPTNTVVACQEERSQLLNKNRALQMLKAKLYLIKQKENEDKLTNIRGDVKDNAFGSQIRSYVLQPYKMVKDLRTGEETSNTDAVFDGKIEPFINSYLRWLKLGCPDRKVINND